MESKLHPLAARMSDIEPFYVMDLLARARLLERAGRSIVHMEIGEPDFVTPKAIVEAGREALLAGRTHYTAALGLEELREAISAYYQQRYGIEVPVQRIAITPGASGALQLALGVLVSPGDAVLITDPGYPCHRHFVRMFEGQPRTVPVDASTNFQLSSEHVDQNWSERTRAVLLASPSNPTGTVVTRGVLSEIQALVESRRGRLIMDEIYHGLVYEHRIPSVLEMSDQAFVINSFSKYFGMTGWRIGWLVVPEGYQREVDKLAQNIFIAASTPAQYAALAAFTPEVLAELEVRRHEFRVRRDYLLSALRDLGFEIPVTPTGAFYLYAGCGRFTNDSYQFALKALEDVGVAITPGLDFGTHCAVTHIRFAYTTSLENLQEGIRRLTCLLS
jgi:Aspartate/tyrosine/aromatic aminotransferase